MDGRTHNWVNIGVTSGIIVGAGLAHYVSLGDLFKIAAVSTIGLLVSPDLDQETGNISYYYMRQMGLHRLWGWYWQPYTTIPHRSWLSHWPFISTLFRLLYIVTPCWLFLFTNPSASRVLILQVFGAIIFTLGLQSLTMCDIFSIYIGLCIPDIAHFILDQLP